MKIQLFAFHGIIGTKLTDEIPGGVIIGVDSPNVQIKVKNGMSKTLEKIKTKDFANVAVAANVAKKLRKKS